MRFRRSRGLTCYWYQGSFIAHPYPHRDPTALHPVAAEILSAFEEFTEPADAAKALGHLAPEDVEDAVRELSEAGLLLAEDSPDVERDESNDSCWGPWAPEVPFFHYATQDVAYTHNDAATGQAARTPQADDETLPAMFTRYPDADRLLLPRIPANLHAPYDQVLYARRTHRDFTSRPVPLATLAALLSTVFGPVDYIDSGRSALLRRTSPAGGARQELDAYVGVLNVTGAEPGMYHYNSLEHSLELVSTGLTPEETVHLCANQDWTGRAAFIIVLVAAFERVSVKYRTPRAYRVTLLNAGHLGQTFALTATALGIGPAQTGAFADTPIAARCGLDNVTRTPLYVLLGGFPQPNGQEAPAAATLATFRHTAIHT
ncbi:SagB/ThcOx family dehydrogenase [Streptomyces abikoensis]|uniref:SagB/ThcOx family dehydrogenase n=1 Tax=Streptomyces abikoensis TaxID=97398 RepID=UPI003716AE3B